MAAAVASGGNGKWCFRGSNVLSLGCRKAVGIQPKAFFGACGVRDGFFAGMQRCAQCVALQMQADSGLWVKPGAFFRAGARVTFFGAKKVTKENIQVQFETANWTMAGIFR
jgi:hypothetical protein